MLETMDRPAADVCPWDTIPEANFKPTPDVIIPISSGILIKASKCETNIDPSQLLKLRSSCKNSSQLDSCSSSSDISITIMEASERLRKSYDLQHVNTGGVVNRNDFATNTRNFSINYTSERIKLSDTSRPSASSGDYVSPEQSFDFTDIVAEKLQAETASKDKDISMKLSTMAPLLNISAIVDDLTRDTTEIEKEDDEKENGEPLKREESETKINIYETEKNIILVDDSFVQIIQGTKESAEETPVVPAWEPDIQQKQLMPTTVVAQEQRDNNINEVCPWEDEENCRVDAPYVKIYATLGYL